MGSSIVEGPIHPPIPHESAYPFGSLWGGPSHWRKGGSKNHVPAKVQEKQEKRGRPRKTEGGREEARERGVSGTGLVVEGGLGIDGTRHVGGLVGDDDPSTRADLKIAGLQARARAKATASADGGARGKGGGDDGAGHGGGGSCCIEGDGAIRVGAGGGKVGGRGEGSTPVVPGGYATSPEEANSKRLAQFQSSAVVQPHSAAPGGNKVPAAVLGRPKKPQKMRRVEENGEARRYGIAAPVPISPLLCKFFDLEPGSCMARTQVRRTI